METPTPSSTGRPRGGRFVILGASNVSLGLPHLVAAIAARTAGSRDLLVAAGHGRCYAGPGRFLARILPPISQCGLWESLDDNTSRHQSEARPTRALIADIGNDLMSGRSPAGIAQSIETCLGRLSRVGANVLLTGLPTAGLLALGSRRYLIVRSLLFPGRALSLATVQQRALELDGLLRRLAEDHDARFIEPDSQWFRIDPIHIQRASRAEAWDQVVSCWGLERESPRPLETELGAVLASRRASRARFAPEHCTVFGFVKKRPQPVLEWTDGSTLSCF